MGVRPGTTAGVAVVGSNEGTTTWNSFSSLAWRRSLVTYPSARASGSVRGLAIERADTAAAGAFGIVTCGILICRHNQNGGDEDG